MRSLKLDTLIENFPHEDIRPVQERALDFIAKQPRGALLEVPTGEGKTAIGLAVLRALASQGKGPLYYVTPTKTQVEQVASKFPLDVACIYGRAEYSCLYYEEQGIADVNAEESPCYMLKCGHRVDQDSGQTEEEGAEPCPYLHEKFVALRRSKEGGAVVCTTAFFLMNRLMVPNWRDADPEMVVVDEAHRLPNIARGIFEHKMTDFHLLRIARILKPLDRGQAAIVLEFVRAFRRIARKRPSAAPSLLKDDDLVRLVAILNRLETKALEKRIREAIRQGTINPLEQKTEIKLLETLVRKIPQMIRSIEYALEQGEKRPLNYVVAFYYKEDDPEFEGTAKKARYHLTIRSYFVAPIIKKALGERIVAYSATIGDPRIFGYESGLKLPFASFQSSFDAGNTRVFLPLDTPNLSMKARRRNDLNRTLRMIVRSAKQFAAKGHRSLIVVVSEDERRKFLAFAAEEGLETVSYGNGMKARDAAAAFVRGEGDALVGTTGQYAEGVDLPRGIAPVIFFLRPGYQRPDDPQTQFEERRFSNGHCWALWNWRVMMEALQVRGRNIRTAEDIGVCFFISQQFRRFLYNALPEWLRPAYKAQVSMEAAVQETMKLLK